MARPSKPISMIDAKKTHLTKEQRKIREEAEADTLSGVGMSESLSVKKDKVAHKEFLRVKKMLGAIEKDDALYETVINRYCELLSECEQLKEERRTAKETMEQIAKSVRDIDKQELAGDERADVLIALGRSLVNMQRTTNKIDSVINQKRTMLFNIEKENIFTIAAALRTVPKQKKEEVNPLLEALGK